MSTARTATPSKFVHVVEWETDKSIHVVDCRRTGRADKVEDGMQHNLDHDKYYTKITDCPHDVMDAVQCVLCVAGVEE